MVPSGCLTVTIEYYGPACDLLTHSLTYPPPSLTQRACNLSFKGSKHINQTNKFLTSLTKLFHQRITPCSIDAKHFLQPCLEPHRGHSQCLTVSSTSAPTYLRIWLRARDSVSPRVLCLATSLLVLWDKNINVKQFRM